MKPIRVVVDARIPAVGWGGVQQVALGLAAGLSAIDEPDVEVIYQCYPDGPDWLRPFVVSDKQLRLVAPPHAPASSRAWVARRLPLVRSVYQAVAPPVPVPRSDGSLEALEPDIVHFPHQAAFLTSVPSVYQPHDLQHVHLPQFFTRRDWKTRDMHYRAFCAQAALVAMASTWGRDDILNAYRLPPEKVGVVPLAPIVDRYPAPTAADLEEVRTRLALPEAFAFYPAQTWPHKNHERLLLAVAQLREREGLEVPLVFSGASTPYRGHLEAVAARHGISRQVRWVGFVDTKDVRALYMLARCLVVPTLFESTSQPIFEALSAGLAVACSNVTATPRQVEDAALLFDPYSVDDIASAVQRLWTGPDLREDLVRRGRRRIGEFSWDRTARHFCAYYRLISGRELSPDDRDLITRQPII